MTKKKIFFIVIIVLLIVFILGINKKRRGREVNPPAPVLTPEEQTGADMPTPAPEAGTGADTPTPAPTPKEQTGAGNPATESPKPKNPVSPRNFPQLSLDFFDATKVHPDARGFQLVFFEKNKRRAIFIPWGGGSKNVLSTLLAYHTDRAFKDPASYEAADLTKLVHSDAQGFGTAFMDEANQWLYFPAFRKNAGSGLTTNTLMVRFNLTKDLSDASAYEYFDVASLKLPYTGWVHGGFVNGFAYFSPTLQLPRSTQHGIFLRYDASKPFGDPSAWSSFDLVKNVHAQAKGFQSAEVKAPFIYLIPYGVGASHFVRYDTRAPFANHNSYEVFDTTTLYPNAKGFTASVIRDDLFISTPWRDLSRSRRDQSMGIAAAFDTRKRLTDANAWSFIDLTTVDPNAKGYQGGWTDQQGFVYFVPTANFSIGKPPPFVIWDSQKPFSQASSWMSVPSKGVPPSTGAASDGKNRAWLGAYGIDGNSGLITQVTSVTK